MELIKRCTSRKIGRQNDRLATMSGLAKIAQHEYGYKDYLAGLWKEFLPDQLLWFTMGGNNARRAPEYRAPTWSFASVENAEYFTHGFETTFWTERSTLAQVVSVECLPATADPTGIVASGSITLTGPVRRGVLGIQHNKGQITVGDESHDMIPDYRILEPAVDSVPPCNLAEVKQTDPVALTDRVISGTSEERPMRGHDNVEVTLMAICNEDRGETRIGGKGQNTLFLLVLKSRGWYTAGLDGPLTAHERIGLLELDQPDIPERWLRGAQTETITIL